MDYLKFHPVEEWGTTDALLNPPDLYFPFWYEQGIFIKKLLYTPIKVVSWDIFPYPKNWILV